MLRFTMEAKELKKLVERASTCVSRKPSMTSLARILVQVDKNGTVKILGTDMEHTIEIRSGEAEDTYPGTAGIDINDLKIISKMAGDVTMEDSSTEKEGRLSLKCGNRIVSIPKYECDGIIELPCMEAEELILTLDHSWLLNTLIALLPFTSRNDNIKAYEAFHFDTLNKRVDALSGPVLVTRTLDSQRIEQVAVDDSGNILLHRKCVPVFKKVLGKDSGEEVKVFQNKDFVHVEGRNFTYVIRRIDGEYPQINKVFKDVCGYSFVPKRVAILEAIKFSVGFSKEHLNPLVFHSCEEELYLYRSTGGYKVLDRIETKRLEMKESLFIAFNPDYLMAAFAVVDKDEPVCRGLDEKGLLYIDGEEYHFAICPVRNDNDLKERMLAQIDRAK